jgi:hypothetical protein
MSITVGFTGSRYGMTEWQELELILFCASNTEGPITFLHGDCIGADEQAARIFRAAGAYTEGYPGHIPQYRANFPSDFTHEPQNTLVRNRIIVDRSELMIATPYSYSFKPGSGTWMTINYAVSTEKPLQVLYPDGSRRLNDQDFYRC